MSMHHGGKLSNIGRQCQSAAAASHRQKPRRQQSARLGCVSIYFLKLSFRETLRLNTR